MKKVFLLLALLVAFTSCDLKQNKKTKLHSYVTTDDDGILYWYLFYGQNDTYYTYSSRVPVSDFVNVAWDVSNSIPSSITTAKELPVTELEDNAVEEVEEVAEDAVDNSPEAETDSSSDSDSSDSGDSGGDGGGGE